MNTTVAKLLVALIALLGAGAAYYYWQQQRENPPPAPVEVPEASEAPAPLPAEPEIRHPIEQAVPAEVPKSETAPLPALEASDGVVGEQLAQLFPRGTLLDLVVTREFVRRLVVTVDNLPRPQVPIDRLPVRRPQGAFLVGRDAAGTLIGADNAARYTPYVLLAEAVDSQRLVAAYVRLYPLFQQAYRDLGYPRGYFNDRLVEVIDLLLATPEVAAPIRLEQPRVLYRFADPRLEALPVGQKILLRMGPDNAARIKAKLRDLRRLLASAEPQPAS